MVIIIGVVAMIPLDLCWMKKVEVVVIFVHRYRKGEHD